MLANRSCYHFIVCGRVWDPVVGFPYPGLLPLYSFNLIEPTGAYNATPVRHFSLAVGYLHFILYMLRAACLANARVPAY